LIVKVFGGDFGRKEKVRREERGSVMWWFKMGCSCSAQLVVDIACATTYHSDHLRSLSCYAVKTVESQLSVNMLEKVQMQ